MSVFLVGIATIAGIILGKILFIKWFNHLTLYSFIMGGLIFLYELKLLPYHDIVPLAWFYIVASFLSIILGTISVISIRRFYNYKEPLYTHSDIKLKLFADNGKVLKYAIIIFSLIGLFVALQRWYVLLNMFGSITGVLVNAAVVYRLNVDGEIKGFIPILPSFIYVAIFLAGIYTAYKKKFTFLSFLPFIGVVLKGFTNFGRAELLLTLMEFLFSFLLFRHLLKKDSSKRFKFSKSNSIFASVIFVVLLIAVTSLVRVSRGSYESFVGTSTSLKQFKNNLIFSPSTYLYLSSDIGVFSKYIQLENEKTTFGQNTFFIMHTFLSRFGLVEKPPNYQRGYHIPMWTNTGTFLRELHADFGIAGILFAPYLIGVIITFLWYKFYEEESLITFALLIYSYLIIGFSFLAMATRQNQWYISLFFIILIIPFLEKMAIKKAKHA